MINAETTPIFEQTRMETLIDPFRASAIIKRGAFPTTSRTQPPKRKRSKR